MAIFLKIFRKYRQTGKMYFIHCHNYKKNNNTNTNLKQKKNRCKTYNPIYVYHQLNDGQIASIFTYIINHRSEINTHTINNQHNNL